MNGTGLILEGVSVWAPLPMTSSLTAKLPSLTYHMSATGIPMDQRNCGMRLIIVTGWLGSTMVDYREAILHSSRLSEIWNVPTLLISKEMNPVLSKFSHHLTDIIVKRARAYSCQLYLSRVLWIQVYSATWLSWFLECIHNRYILIKTVSEMNALHMAGKYFFDYMFFQSWSTESSQLPL